MWFRSVIYDLWFISLSVINMFILRKMKSGLRWRKEQQAERSLRWRRGSQLRIQTSLRGLPVLFLFSCMDLIFAVILSLFYFYPFYELILWILFICREDFRKTYKEKHPNNKSVSAVSSCTSFRSRILAIFAVSRSSTQLFLCFYRLERQGVRNGNPCLRL